MASGLWKSLGSALRQAGRAVDALGCSIQGKYCYKETLSKHRTLQAYQGHRPQLGHDCFVAPNASVVGDVKLGNRSSIWYGAVLRGDVNSISIGDNSNLQDGVIVHVAKHNPQNKAAPTVIGNNVTIGHAATIHACTVEDGALVGMGAVLLDGVTVQKGSIVAAGALVRPGTVVPAGEVWAGNPAKKLRALEDGEAAFILQSAANYAELAAVHAAENAKTSEEVQEDEQKREDRAQRDPDYDSHLGLLRDPVNREIITTAQHT